MTVVNLAGGLNLNNQNIQFTGAGYLVINISSSFSLTGTASILALGGADLTHIFINYTGTGTVNTHVGDTVDGYIFDPFANANLDGAYFGGLYGGTNNVITLLSQATITSEQPSSVPDAAGTALLLGMGLAGIALARRGFQKRRAQIILLLKKSSAVMDAGEPPPRFAQCRVVWRDWPDFHRKRSPRHRCY